MPRAGLSRRAARPPSRFSFQRAVLRDRARGTKKPERSVLAITLLSGVRCYRGGLTEESPRGWGWYPARPAWGLAALAGAQR